MVLPKSQYAWWDGGTMQALFKDAELPGSKTFNNLPRGSAVICHSALVHGRRAKPGGDGHPRYFVDISYCQPGKYSWPNDMARKDAERELAKERGLDRGGEYGAHFARPFLSLPQMRCNLHSLTDVCGRTFRFTASLWDNKVFVSHSELPEEAQVFTENRAAYREQVQRQTDGKFHRLGGGNG
eukprot:SAG31_NODE_1174_length_9538_cov_3.152453_14_plen_183_part_00